MIQVFHDECLEFDALLDPKSPLPPPSAFLDSEPTPPQGPGMGGPLVTCALVARMLSLMWKRPIVAVNHCVGR